MQSFVGDDPFQPLIEDHREGERGQEDAGRHSEGAVPAADDEADEGAKNHERGRNDACKSDAVEELPVIHQATSDGIGMAV